MQAAQPTKYKQNHWENILQKQCKKASKKWSSATTQKTGQDLRSLKNREVYQFFVRKRNGL
jgi:hypothetical protein